MKPYSIGLYEKALPANMTWRDRLTCAKECGYDFLEISIDETDERLARLEWTREERLELVCLMSELGLPIRSMCLSGHRKYPFGSTDPAVRARSLDIMEKAIVLADDLGIRTIQLAGYDVYYEQSSQRTKELFAQGLRQAVDMAAARGIVMGFETMENDFMDTVWKAMYYVREVGSPYLGVYPDTGNLTNASVLYGRDVVGDLASGAGHLFALHVKESVPGAYREVPFFTGHVDFKALIAKAWEMGVRRYLTEMWCVDDGWLEAIHQAHDGIAAILDELTNE